MCGRRKTSAPPCWKSRLLTTILRLSHPRMPMLPAHFDSADAHPKAAFLQLSMIPGVGPLTRRRLLERFGNPHAVLNAAPSDLQSVAGVGPKLCRSIADARNQIDVVGEIA